MKVTSLLTAFAVSTTIGCTPFTPLAIELANQQPAAGATTWQATTCIRQATIGGVTTSEMASGGYAAKTNPLGDEFYQKTITDDGLFGEFINATLSPKDDLFARRCGLSASFDDMTQTALETEVTNVLAAYGYSLLYEKNSFTQVYSNGTDRIDVSVQVFDIDGSVIIGDHTP